MWPHYCSALTSSLSLPPAPFTLASSLFLTQTRQATAGPWHRPFPLPVLFFPPLAPSQRLLTFQVSAPTSLPAPRPRQEHRLSTRNYLHFSATPAALYSSLAVCMTLDSCRSPPNTQELLVQFPSTQPLKMCVERINRPNG